MAREQQRRMAKSKEAAARKRAQEDDFDDEDDFEVDDDNFLEDDDGEIGSGDGDALVFDPNPSSYPASTPDQSFAAYSWDTAEIDGWRIDLVPVPAPTSLAALAAVPLASCRRRRR